MRPPRHLEEAGVVLHAEGHVVAPAEPDRGVELRQPVGRRVELGVGLHGSRGGHDLSRTIGDGGGEVTGEHGRRR